MKRTILASLAVTAMMISGYAQEKKSKFGAMLDKGAEAVKKEVNNTGSSGSSGTSGTTAAGTSSGAASGSVGGGSTSDAPTSWLSARPMNPKISNKLPRLYTAADGAYLYTTSESPSSALHKANLDKVVFAKSRVNKDGDASQLSTTFKVGDAIYGRAFMRSCMSNYKVYMTEMSNEPAKCMSGNFDVNYVIDDKIYGTLMSSSLSGEMEDKATFTIITVGTGEDAEANNEDFIKELNALPAGNHKIRLIVWATQGQFISVDPVAIGEFTFVKDAGAKAMGLGRSFANVKAQMEDAALQDKCLKKMNAHAKANGWKETFTEVKIIDEDWSTIRHPKTGIVTGRIINIAAKATWPDAHCTYQEFSMIQDHDGTTYMNAVQVYGVGSQTQIDCN